jgi:predicted dehydrogenase
VQDKLWLPGILKLKRLIQQDFFGRILSVRGEFGYWVFEGDSIPGTTPFMELPERRRRGYYRRYAVPLAVPAR